MDRIIEVKVGGNYIRKDKKTAGVRGEYEVAILRIEFDESWDEYEKRITFWDAKGLNPTFRALDATRLENHTQSKRVFLVPIPEKPMSEAGEMTFVIDGFVSIYNQDGSVERKKQRSMADKLEVKYAPVSADAGEPTTPEATIVDQMMSELGRINDSILEAVDAKEDILNMTVSSETLTPDEVAFVIRSDNDGVPHLLFGIPKGDTGDSGVYIGSSEPTDPAVNVWIAPDGEETVLIGESAYEIALADGFEGTEEEWLESLHGDDYVLTDSDIEEIADLVEEHTSEITVILTASGWEGTAAPYMQTVNVDGMAADTQGTVFVSESATDEQYNAAMYAMLRKTAQGTNSITLKAYGEKPTIDIPLTVRIGG